jgi:hypothetical protein
LKSITVKIIAASASALRIIKRIIYFLILK